MGIPSNYVIKLTVQKFVHEVLCIKINVSCFIQEHHKPDIVAMFCDNKQLKNQY